jgi:hypothetical protein
MVRVYTGVSSGADLFTAEYPEDSEYFLWRIGLKISEEYL